MMMMTIIDLLAIASILSLLINVLLSRGIVLSSVSQLYMAAGVLYHRILYPKGMDWEVTQKIRLPKKTCMRARENTRKYKALKNSTLFFYSSTSHTGSS